MTEKTTNQNEEDQPEQKPGDNPPDQKLKEAEAREGKTFSGKGREVKK